jgi:hypothetical protein
MKSVGIPSLKRTQFTQSIVRANALDKSGFKVWFFRPGMLFNSLDKWWGDHGERDKPHEGLDICLYKDRQDRILCLDGKTKIPAMVDGVVVRIFNDFLGKSLIVKHDLPKNDSGRFYTIYGHTNPLAGLHVGNIVKGGDIIATLVDPIDSKHNILPHLHISLGWASKYISYDQLDWETIGSRNTLTLLDPLHVIGEYYPAL